ncbi:MAG: isopeptide-forming domain-containing fimbrial protein [Eubacteriales bacterium]|nr:isopeptide-forming domain-containing fimbrial protein [Eubacteriales bacterium]
MNKFRNGSGRKAAVIAALLSFIFAVVFISEGGNGVQAAGAKGSAADGGSASARFVKDGGHYGTWTHPNKKFKLPAKYTCGLKTTKKTSYTYTGTLANKDKALKAMHKKMPYKGSMVTYYSAETMKSHEKTFSNKNALVWKLSAANKGKISLTTKNLKIWNETKQGYDMVDRVMSVTGWKNARDTDKDMYENAFAGPYLLLKKGANPTVIVHGADSVSIRYRYYQAGTKTLYTYDGKAPMAIGITIGDIDCAQKVTYTGGKSGEIKYMAVAEDTNLDYVRDGKSVTFCQTGENVKAHKDIEQDSAAIYADSSDFTLKFTTGYMPDKGNIFYHKTGMWSYFNMRTKALDPVVPRKPQKSVEDSDEKSGDAWSKKTAESYTDAFASEDEKTYSYCRSNRLTDKEGKPLPAEEFIYHVTHELSDRYSENTRVTYYRMTDDIDKRLDVKAVSVWSGGDDVSGSFDISTAKGTAGTAVSAQLKNPTLSGTNGKAFELRIKVQVADDYRGIFKKQTFENVGHVEIRDKVGNDWTGDKRLSTLKTATVLEGEPEPPVKTVSDDDMVTQTGEGDEKSVKENTVAKPDEVYTYEVSKDWNSSESSGGKSFVKSFCFVDVMDDLLDAEGAKVRVLTSEGKNISSEFEIEKKGQRISARAKDPLKGDFHACVAEKKTVCMVIEVTFKKQSGKLLAKKFLKSAGRLDGDGGCAVENVGAAVINDYPVNSNKVKTHLYFDTPDIPDPKKAVSDGDDTIMQRYSDGAWKLASGKETGVLENTLASPSGVWTYELSPAWSDSDLGSSLEDLKELTFTDEVDKHISIIPDSVRLYYGRKDVSSHADVGITAGVLSARLKPSAILESAGSDDSESAAASSSVSESSTANEQDSGSKDVAPADSDGAAASSDTSDSGFRLVFSCELKDKDLTVDKLRALQADGVVSKDGKYMFVKNKASLSYRFKSKRGKDIVINKETNDVVTNILPVEEPVPDKPKPDEPEPKTKKPEPKPSKVTPKTGDRSGIYVYAIILSQAIAAVLILGVIRNGRNSH